MQTICMHIGGKHVTRIQYSLTYIAPLGELYL